MPDLNVVYAASSVSQGDYSSVYKVTASNNNPTRGYSANTEAGANQVNGLFYPSTAYKDQNGKSLTNVSASIKRIPASDAVSYQDAVEKATASDYNIKSTFFFDFSLTNNGTQVTSLSGGKMRLAVWLPDRLKDVQNLVAVRIHDGEISILDVTTSKVYDKNGVHVGTYAFFYSDKFSVYAIAEAEKIEKSSSEPEHVASVEASNESEFKDVYRSGQGPLAMAVYAAAMPSGYEAITCFNVKANGMIDYSKKNGKLSIVLDSTTADTYKSFKLIALDKDGRAYVYDDMNKDQSIVSAIINVEGYAFMLVGSKTTDVVATTEMGDTYVVRKGDTLSKIAKAMKTTVKSLAEKNNIANPNLIRVGQVINR